MQRNDLKSWRELTQLIKPLIGSKVEFHVVSYTLFMAYLVSQKTMNKLAQFFWDKKEHNPSLESWVNNNFNLNTSDVDHQSYHCAPKINYTDLLYIHQPRIFDCGDTAIEMLLKYQIQKCKEFSQKIDINVVKEFANKFDARKIHFFSGKDADELRSYSKYLATTNLSKIKDGMSVESFAYYLYQNGPIIVRMNELGGHFLVIKGVHNDQIVFHDPWSGPNIVLSFQDFKKLWDGTIIYFISGYSKELEANISSNQTLQMK